jgi:hypothetical protein
MQNNIFDHFASYFEHRFGEVPWQYSKIYPCNQNPNPVYNVNFIIVKKLANITISTKTNN